MFPLAEKLFTFPAARNPSSAPLLHFSLATSQLRLRLFCRNEWLGCLSSSSRRRGIASVTGSNCDGRKTSKCRYSP